jgi:hypothetical protein
VIKGPLCLVWVTSRLRERRENCLQRHISRQNGLVELGNRPSRAEPEEDDEASPAVKDPLSKPVGGDEGLLMGRDFVEAVTDERFVSFVWNRTSDP